MKPALPAALVCALALVATACGRAESTIPADCQPKWEFSTIERGTLTVAAVQQLPSIDISPTGKKTGIDSVLLPKFAKQACLKIDWKPLAGPAAVTAMTEGKADVAAGGWYKTAERGEVIGQSVTTWYDSPGLVSKSGVNSIGELVDKKVGVVGGALFVQPLKNALGASSVKVFQSVDAVFQELNAGRIAAGIGSGAVLKHLVEARGSDAQLALLDPNSRYPELTAAGEANYPHTKSNKELEAALNDFIKTARSNGTMKSVLDAHGLTDPSYLKGPA